MEEKRMQTAGEILSQKTRAPKVCVTPDQTIDTAIRIMVNANIGAILVEQEDQILGIWTERDLLRSMGQPDFDPKTAIIRDHMKTKLYSADYDTPLIKLEEMFLGLFIRHILVKKEGQYIGLLSIGDVLRTSLLQKDKKIKELNSIASWQYYENWGWDRFKRK